MKPATSTSKILGCAATWTILCALGCGRLGFDSRVIDADASTPEVDASPSADAEAGEASIQCGPTSFIIPIAPAAQRSEPTLYVDNLTLLVRGPANLQAVRPSIDDAFGDFGSTSLTSTGMQDPTYLDLNEHGLGNEIIAIGSENIGAQLRKLIICVEPFADTDCEDARVFDELGVEITDDRDGPNLAVLDGEPIMVFNRVREIYLARPREGDFAVWDATLIPVVRDDDEGVDDPSLSRDGRLLFIPIQVSAGNAGRIDYMIWNDATARFENQRAMPELDGKFSPEAGVRRQDEIELFVTSLERGLSEPKRTECTVSRGSQSRSLPPRREL